MSEFSLNLVQKFLSCGFEDYTVYVSLSGCAKVANSSGLAVLFLQIFSKCEYAEKHPLKKVS